MIVSFNGHNFEIDNPKFDTTMKMQKAQFNDVIVHYRSTGDLQGLIYILFCMKCISEDIIERMVNEIGVDKIGSLITDNKLEN